MCIRDSVGCGDHRGRLVRIAEVDDQRIGRPVPGAVEHVTAIRRDDDAAAGAPASVDETRGAVARRVCHQRDAVHGKCRIIRAAPMANDSGGPPPATAPGTAGPRRSALSADVVRAFTDRAPRCRVAMQVLYTVPGETPTTELIEAELVNVSSSGMLLANAQPLPLGAVVGFQFKLAEGQRLG